VAHLTVRISRRRAPSAPPSSSSAGDEAPLPRPKRGPAQPRPSPSLRARARAFRRRRRAGATARLGPAPQLERATSCGPSNPDETEISSSKTSAIAHRLPQSDSLGAPDAAALSARRKPDVSDTRGANPDGSTTAYFGPSKPAGAKEGNWIQTMPAKAGGNRGDSHQHLRATVSLMIERPPAGPKPGPQDGRRPDRHTNEDGPARLFIMARSDRRFTDRSNAFNADDPSSRTWLADQGPTVHVADHRGVTPTVCSR
jgi:hypothetical protein